MTEDSVRAWPWKWSLFVRRFLAVAAMFSRTHTSVATRVAAADSSSDSAHLRSRCPDWTTWKSMRALWLRQLHELQVPLTFLNFVTTTEWPVCGKEFQTTVLALRHATRQTCRFSHRTEAHSPCHRGRRPESDLAKDTCPLESWRNHARGWTRDLASSGCCGVAAVDRRATWLATSFMNICRQNVRASCLSWRSSESLSSVRRTSNGDAEECVIVNKGLSTFG